MIRFSRSSAELAGESSFDTNADLYTRYPDGAPRSNSNADSSVEQLDLRYSYSYVIITRDKSQMHPIIEHFSNAASLARQMFSGSSGLALSTNLPIASKDVELISQLRLQTINTKVVCEIMHYQIVHQTWRMRPGILVPRTVILTPSHALLFYEELHAHNVQLILLDKAAYGNVVEVKIEKSSPGHITFVLRASPLITKTRKWRLYLNNQQALSRLYDAIKSCCADAKNPI